MHQRNAFPSLGKAFPSLGKAALESKAMQIKTKFKLSVEFMNINFFLSFQLQMRTHKGSGYAKPFCWAFSEPACRQLYLGQGKNTGEHRELEAY